MNAVTHIDPPDTLSVSTLITQRRAAIDLITTTRAKMIRASLFANYLFRPHPFQPESQAVRQSWLTALQVQLDDLEQVCELMEGDNSRNSVHIDIATWIAGHAAMNHQTVQTLATMRTMTQALVDAAQKDDLNALERAIVAHHNFGRVHLFEAVTTFIDVLWSDLDENRNKEVERANATASAIDKTLRRLEHIGKHVRLVSLNASVEAARVGDAGRGLGVIAVEFKTLAEEIQRLAVTARADITSMERQ
ncbi:MAG: methyl-accepting chemotaxis protein [Tateyamaria sp.]|uniref:methyl-accepting chemotaxis protein n=1 Tax=Tateyamaria sp. TaxID=1929288 RepID=UPI0032A0A606